MEFMEKRRKFFAAKRAEEKRNKPPTKTQQRNIMCTYLKNMEGYKMKDLKHFDFGTIKEKFDKAFKMVNTFKDFRTELVEGNKGKGEGTKLNKLIEVTEEVAIDAVPLAVKTLIVGWKIYKEGKKSYYQITRAGGNSQRYLVFSHMLRNFNREDLEDLWKLVKAKYGSTRPVEDLDLVLWNDLKNMFEPNVEDTIWRKQDGYKVLEWKLHNNYGVHTLKMQYMQVYMLVEKIYPLTPPTFTMMLDKKLKADHQDGMCYQLLKLTLKQLNKKE
ncbi:hypothetical protein Tco_1157131 [Tanacetum coccineum]